MLVYNYFSSVNSNIFIPISTNQTLQSNKNYIATTNSTVQLPSTIIIGDTISLATNSTSVLRVGLPSGYSIINPVTNEIITVAQVGGINLTSSQSIQLVYQGANLWSITYLTSVNSLIKYWDCAGGICSESYLGNYTSLANCQSLLVPATFTGGQCPVFYIVDSTLYRTNLQGVESIQELSEVGALGAIQSIETDYGVDTLTNGKTSITWKLKTTNGLIFLSSNSGGNGIGYVSGRGVITGIRLRDAGTTDNCGNLPASCPIQYWQCSGGQCTFSSTPTPYTSQAACQSAIIQPGFTGGQCPNIEYVVEFDYIVHNPNYGASTWSSRLNDADIPIGSNRLKPMRINGSIASIIKNASSNIIEARNSAGQLVTESSSIGSIANGFTLDFTLHGVKRSDGQLDNCGSLLPTCPV